MVFQQEERSTWLFPLIRWAGEKGLVGARGDSEEESEKSRDTVFDMADSMEKGCAREILTEFLQPLRPSSTRCRMHIIISADGLQHSLFTASGDFLMFARVCLNENQVLFYQYHPNETSVPFNAERPAFTLMYNGNKSEWRLVHERCEHCEFLPECKSCARLGKQQVAVVRHSDVSIGDGVCHTMSASLPRVLPHRSRVIWCPTLGYGDLSTSTEGNKVQQLCTKLPIWNPDVKTLMSDFKSRRVQPSAKNFQLTLQSKPEQIVCQYGKIGQSTFSLEMSYPLSVIQCFALAMTTIFWV